MVMSSVLHIILVYPFVCLSTNCRGILLQLQSGQYHLLTSESNTVTIHGTIPHSLIDFIIAVGLATLPVILHYGYVNTMLLSLITWFFFAVNLWFLICNVDQSVDQFNNRDPPSILCKYLNLIYYRDSILSNFFPILN